MSDQSEELERRRLEYVAAIQRYVQEEGLNWVSLQARFPRLLTNSDKSAYYKLSSKEGTYRSARKFYDIIFAKNVDPTFDIAAEHVGAYSRIQYEGYEGIYALIRPSIHESNVIYGYRCEIKWVQEQRVHRLNIESERALMDSGIIYFPVGQSSMCIHFNSGSNHSMMILRNSLGDKNCYGVMASILPTLNTHHYAPACVPIVLVREEREIPLNGGYIDKRHELFEKSYSLICSVPSQDVVTTGWWSKLQNTN